MNEQKPTGPKPKWWSRPQAGRPRETEAPAAEAPASAPSTEVPADTYDLAPPVSAGEAAATSAAETHPASPAHPISAPSPQDAPPAAPAPPSDEAGAPQAAQDVPLEPATEPATEPSTDPAPVAEPAVITDPDPIAVPAAITESARGAEPEPLAPRQPLHAPDPYGTPPYGGPGPWAPAPPVQRPVPTPPGGTSLPQQSAYAAPQASAAEAPAPQAPVQQAPVQQTRAPQAPVPQAPASGASYAAPAAPPVPPASQWVQYDPWAAPGEPLSRIGRPGPKRRRGALLVGAVLLALVAGGIGGGVGAYVERNGGITSVKLPQSGKEPQGRAPDSVAGIAASALPSVVTIHVTGATESGTGTGFVLDNAGHILTNNHVVQPAGDSGKISVTFSGGESAPAQVVGRDSGYDLAVVKVDGVSGMKPLPLGNSDNVLVGDPVVAIGAPFDLSNTVTSGIISAKERPITAGGESGDGSDVSYVDALQTDAPINPGNSGGPLVDSKARVIGINSAIRSAGSGSTEGSGGQAGSIGLGFAIPVNQAKRVAEELINTGKATHPVIGVTLDMKFTGDGARVGDKASDGKPAVATDGPGAKAGIRSQDVITKVDGQRVHSGEELIVKIRAHRPGDRLKFTVQRDGKVQELTLTLGSSS
ncbi:trypsin-like peptidase domain-containing protein [Streptomyces violascens]|uniref:S1C family serine protease n=1 Tax=Streptomyces violascens TaxID=67381 RepID=UPI0036540E4E